MKTTPRVTSRDALRKLAASLGATLSMEIVGNQYSIDVDAPVGKVWKGNGCHAIAVACYTGPEEWKAEARGDAFDTMSYGLEDCETPDCDVCEERRAQ